MYYFVGSRGNRSFAMQGPGVIMIEFFKNKIKEISIFRWLLAFLLFIAVSNASYRFLEFYRTPSCYSVLINQINLSILGFSLLYIHILICGDIITKKEFDKSICDKVIVPVRFYLIYGAFLSLIIMFLFLASNVFLCLCNLTDKFTLIRLESYQNFEFINIMPFIPVYLRLACMCYLIMGFNILSKGSLGFICPIFVSLAEWILRSTVFFYDTNRILPISNTEIIANSNIGINEYNYDVFYQSILYWIVIISLVMIFIRWQYKIKYEKGIKNNG